MLPRWFSWPLRIIVYSFAIILSFNYLVPLVGNPTLGIAISAPIAGLAIALDLLLTSKIRRTSFESEATRRMIIVDSVLSRDPLSLGRGNDREQIETKATFEQIGSAKSVSASEAEPDLTSAESPTQPAQDKDSLER